MKRILLATGTIRRWNYLKRTIVKIDFRHRFVSLEKLTKTKNKEGKL